MTCSFHHRTTFPQTNQWPMYGIEMRNSNKIQRTLNCDELETIQLFQIINKQFECRCEKHAHTSAHRLTHREGYTRPYAFDQKINI